jgi:hypothetical protein
LEEVNLAQSARALLDRLAAEAVNGAAWHEHAANRWARIYFTLGLPAAILAAIAGATALASSTSRIVAGIIALVSAGLTAAATFLDSSNSQRRHRDLAAAWSMLDRDVALVATFELPPIETRIRELYQDHIVASHWDEEARTASERAYQSRLQEARRSLRFQVQALRSRVENLLDRDKQLVAGQVPPADHMRPPSPEAMDAGP